MSTEVIHRHVFPTLNTWICNRICSRWFL